jgi:hypothetical protein
MTPRSAAIERNAQDVLPIRTLAENLDRTPLYIPPSNRPDLDDDRGGLSMWYSITIVQPLRTPFTTVGLGLF